MNNILPDSLKNRAFSSSVLVASSHAVSQGLRLASNLILTRILVPEMFGLMALVNVILSGILLLLDVGFLQSVVRTKHINNSSFLNTVWSVQLISGFCVFILAQLVAFCLYIAGTYNFLDPLSVYGDDKLPLLLSIMSITSIISATNSIYLHVLVRKLTMTRVMILDLSAQAAGIMLMIILAWYYESIWSLVAGGIFSTLIKSLVSHTSYISPVRLRFELNKEHLRDILSFGKWIAVTSILGFMINQGDRAILGGLLTSEQLGIYTIAYFIATAPRLVISKLISTVFFPVLSEAFRERKKDLPNIYYKIKNRVDIITFFSSGILFATGPSLVAIMYDYRYADAGWMLQLLAVSLPAVGFMLVGQCFLASGNSKVMTFIAAIQVITLFITVPIMYSLFETKGAIIAIALNPYMRVVTSMILMKKYFFINFIKESYGIPFFVLGYFLGEVVISVV